MAWMVSRSQHSQMDTSRARPSEASRIVGVIVGVGGPAEVAAFEPVAVAFEVDDFGVMDEPVDHRYGDRWPRAALVSNYASRRLSTQKVTPRSATARTMKILASIPWKAQNLFAGWYLRNPW
jgi:hypothetical protein